MLPTFAPSVSDQRRTAVDSIIGDGESGSEASVDDEDPAAGLAPGKAPAAVAAAAEPKAPAMAPVSDARPARAVALFPYDGSEEGSLAIKAGDGLLVKVRDAGADWCFCKRIADAKEGWVPVRYIHDEDHDE